MKRIKPAWQLLLFAIVMLSGCQSMSEEDKWLWNSSTNAPPPSLQSPGK
jgi:hypothetical protein